MSGCQSTISNVYSFQMALVLHFQFLPFLVIVGNSHFTILSCDVQSELLTNALPQVMCPGLLTVYPEYFLKGREDRGLEGVSSSFPVLHPETTREVRSEGTALKHLANSVPS